MNQYDLFFVIFLSTVIITRVFLFLKPTASPTVKGLRLHHYMYGIAILVIGVGLNNVRLYAIGLGLFLDEVPFLLIGGKTHKDNYSLMSLLGVCILIVLVFVFRKYLLSSLS